MCRTESPRVLYTETINQRDELFKKSGTAKLNIFLFMGGRCAASRERNESKGRDERLDFSLVNVLSPSTSQRLHLFVFS